MTKTARYSHENSYQTLNSLTDQTKNIWICFHGLGYLAKYFKKYLEHLDPAQNYIIVLQAPSKYYQDKSFKHVGASWLTREETEQEIGNNLRYVQSVLENESVAGDPRNIFFGYSQGVSMATRFLKKYDSSAKALILHSGSIPVELNAADGKHMLKLIKQVIHISGKRDEYATPEKVKQEESKLELLFGTNCERHRPDIAHEVDKDLLERISIELA
jgi:predicted esterase